MLELQTSTEKGAKGVFAVLAGTFGELKQEEVAALEASKDEWISKYAEYGYESAEAFSRAITTEL
jgi:hypothetical protein